MERKRDFDLCFGGYLLSRINTLKEEKRTLQATSELLRRQVVALEQLPTNTSTHTPIAQHIDRDCRPEDDFYREETATVKDRVWIASQCLARLKQMPATNRLDLAIHSVGRRVSQLVKQDKIASVEKLIKTHPKVLVMRIGTDGQTLLHVAAAAGAIQCCRLLLDLTGLQLSKEHYDNKDTVGVLLTESTDHFITGFDRLVTDIIGRTPLHHAAEAYKEDVCRFLKQEPAVIAPAGASETKSSVSFVGVAAPQDAAGMTPAGCSALKKPKSAAEKDHRQHCIEILHAPGDACISPYLQQRRLKQKLAYCGTPEGGTPVSKLRLNFDTMQSSQSPEHKAVNCGSGEMPGFRVAMEDASFQALNLDLPLNGVSTEKCHMFGVFDGHGGSGAAAFSATNFTRIFQAVFLRKKPALSTIPELMKHFPQVLAEACLALEEELKTKEAFKLRKVVIRPAIGSEPAVESYEAQDDSGSTLLICALVGDSAFLANVGDCRAILVSLFSESNAVQVEQLTRDHKPSDEKQMTPEDTEFFNKERRRIELVGGALTADHYVLWNKNNTKEKLNMTRSIGDFKFKHVAGVPSEQQPVIAEPEIFYRKQAAVQDPELRRSFVILACDGIWDLMTNEEVGSFVQNSLKHLPASGTPDLDELSKKLLIECLTRRSEDNLSVQIVEVPTLTHGEEEEEEKEEEEEEEGPAETTPPPQLQERLLSDQFETIEL